MTATFRCVLFLPLLFVSYRAPLARAVTIEFGSAFQSLPYVEDGMTFTNLGTSLAVVGANAGDGNLVGGTNVDPIRVRATGDSAFDLVSFDVEQIFRDWRIESSSGGIVNLSGTGTKDFTGVSGFQGISYFEIIHDPGEANGSIRVDNVVFNAVPEPSTIALLASGGALLVLWQARHRVREARRC
jgi:hypothetical protein